MSKCGMIVIGAGVLAVGCLIGEAQAAGYDGTDGAGATENVRTVESDEAVLMEALDDERHYLHRRAMLHRLRAFALEANDRDRLAQLDRLTKVHEQRHDRRYHARLSRMSDETRERFQAMHADRRERMAEANAKAKQQAHDRRDTHRDLVHDRQDAHRDRVHDRQDAHRDLVHDRQDAHLDRVHDRRDAQPSRAHDRRDSDARTRMDTQDRRAVQPRAPRRNAGEGPAHNVTRNAESERDHQGLRNRGHRNANDKTEGVKSSIEGRRPTPPRRRPPGPSGSSLALPTDGEAQNHAAGAISRENADAVYGRLVREIESEE